jgi:hypothetical protein
MISLGPELFDQLNTEQWVGNKQPVIYGKGGMSISEIENIEKQLGFKMPEDFKYLLQNVCDPGDVLFPWSKFSKQKYDELMSWVLRGIEFDIEHHPTFCWLETRWGPRLEILSESLEIVRKDFPSWPKLLPLHGHRFLAAEPCLPDNPVFSIMQTDIIYYGSNLAHYLFQEFVKGQNHADNTRRIIRKIDVWSDFEAGNH